MKKSIKDNRRPRKLVLQHEAIATLTPLQLRYVAGGLDSGSFPPCGSDPGDI
jgi:hypothetical protein